MDKQQQLELARQIAAKHGTGQTLNTSSEIDFASKWNSAFSENPVQKQPTFGGQIIRGAVQPLARLGHTLTKPVEMLADKIGGFDGKGDFYDSYLGNVTGYGMKEGQTGTERAKDIAGGVLQTASYLLPYGKIAKGVGSVSSKVIGDTAGKIVGDVASGATGGYVAQTGMNLEDQQNIGEAITPGIGTTIGGVIPAVAPVLRGVGRLTSKTGSSVAEAVIPKSNRESRILQTYKANNPFFKRVANVLAGEEKAPITVGKTSVTTTAGQTLPGLFGTKSQIGVQAKRAADTLWSDVISPRLKEHQQVVDLDGFFNKVEEDIIKNNPELSRQKSLIEALNAVREDYSGTKVITLERLQKLKEGWAKFVPDKAYNGKPIAGAFNDVRNHLSDEARQTIYNELGDDVKKAYFDYSNLIGLQELGRVAMTGAKLKAGAGSFATELFSRAVTPVATVGGQAVYRIGKGIEFIGELGAKNLGEALGIGKLKFPGDTMLEKKNLNYDATAPSAKQIIQTTTKVKNTSIPNIIPQKTSKVKEVINTLKNDIKNNGQKGSTEMY